MIDNTITSKGVTYTFPLPETAAQMVEYLGEKRAYDVMRRYCLQRLSEWILKQNKLNRVITQEALESYRPNRRINQQQIRLQKIKTEIAKLPVEDRRELLQVFTSEGSEQ